MFSKLNEAKNKKYLNYCNVCDTHGQKHHVKFERITTSNKKQ